MNTLKIEYLLAKKYKYKPLSKELSEKYRSYFRDNIPEWLNETGQSRPLYTRCYSKNVKYIWLTVNDGSGIKIYLQRKGVSYADYRSGKYYVSVHEVFDRKQT